MTGPAVFSGPGAWDALASAFASLGVRRLFVVCGDTAWSKTGARERLGALERSSCLEPSVRFSSFSPNPTVDAVAAAHDEFLRHPADALVGIGGGSAIDVAKGVLDRALREGVRAPILAAIPTTAGTGSEATRFAVLYEDGKKLSLDRPDLRPSLVVLDPELTASLPPYTAACAGLDAIAQAVEALWAVRSTPESDAFADEALSLLLPALRDAVCTGHDTARSQMLRGAHLAGRAIDITRTTAAHAFSYAFTSAHRIPHGHAVWLSLPAVALYNAGVSDADCQDPRGAPFVRDRIARVARRIAGDTAPTALAKALRGLAADIGVELDPFRLGVADRAQLRRLFSGANPARMANNPRALDETAWMAAWDAAAAVP